MTDAYDRCAGPGCNAIVGNENYPAAPGQRCSHCLGVVRPLRANNPRGNSRKPVWIDDFGPYRGTRARLIGPNPNGVGVLVKVPDGRVITAVNVSADPR